MHCSTNALFEQDLSICNGHPYITGAHGGAVGLRHCATSGKVVGSIPGGVFGIFH